MTAVFLYDQTAKRMVNKEIDYTALKLMLLNGATFNAAETSIVTTLQAFEVSGGGWPAGGVLLTSTLIQVISTNDARLQAANVSVTATGADIGPATAFVVYDSVSNFPLLYCDFEAAITAADGTPFRVDWLSNNVIQFIYT